MAKWLKALLMGALSSSGCSLVFDTTSGGGSGTDDGGSGFVDAQINDGGVDRDAPPCTDVARRLLSIDTVGLDEELVDFPILVRLTSANIDYAREPDGSGLRFILNNTPLAYEIDTWNTQGASLVWVNVPSLGPGNDPLHIEMRYGGPTTPGGEDPAGTWNSDYVAVFHLAESTADSTQHGNNAEGNATSMDGFLGTARGFNGTDQTLAVAADTTLNNLSALNFSAWIHPTSSGDHSVLSKGASNPELRLGGPDSSATYLRGTLGFATTIAASQSQARNDIIGEWHQVSMNFSIFDNNRVDLFLDGEQVAYDGNQVLGTGTRVTNSLDLFIGSRKDQEDRFFDGMIDEVRISSKTRSAAWILHSNKAANDTLVTFSDVLCD